MFAFDTLIFLLTIYPTIRELIERRLFRGEHWYYHFKKSLFALLLRDGMVYYMCVFHLKIIGEPL